MPLGQDEIDNCREAFLAFDKDRSGTIDVYELRLVLEAMGQQPTEEELFRMISEVDDDMSGEIDFSEFLKVIENQKIRAEQFNDETDMIDAYVACGGQGDKEGHVRKDVLIRIIKSDFGLPIDIEELIERIDTDGSGEIEFDEFKEIFSGGADLQQNALPFLGKRREAEAAEAAYQSQQESQGDSQEEEYR